METHNHPRLRIAMVVVALTTAAWCAVAIPARATYGARTTADEPQYLLSALSLWEDGSLDIADELRDERWRDFHEAPLPEQTKALDDGRRLSPHDPLLPALLAVPVGLGGWAAGKAVLAGLAGVLAGLLVWVAVRRFAVPVVPAAVVVLTFSLAAPLTAYAAQVYPELPAALAVTVAIAALTGPVGRRGRWTLALAVVTLPWLGVKYAPVAVALAVVGLALVSRRDAVWLAGGLVLAGAAYLAFHRAVYGGWTVYAAGDHFVGGEFTVAGVSPDYVGRSSRLVGLLVDRGFGLAAWAPVYLVGMVAAGALGRRRPPGWMALAVPFAAGWLTATFVALTMHGWWWPGRQVVVVVPCIVLAVAWWVGRSAARAGLVVVLGMVGLVAWGWVVVEVLDEQLRLIIDFDATANPLMRAWRKALPDYRSLGFAHHVVWIVALGLLAAVGWRSAHDPENRRTIDVEADPPGTSRPLDRIAAGSGRVR